MDKAIVIYIIISSAGSSVATFLITKFWDLLITKFFHFWAQHRANNRSYYHSLKNDLRVAIKQFNKDVFPENKIEKVKIEVVNGDNPQLDFYENQTILRISTNKPLAENVEILFRKYTEELLLSNLYDKLTSQQKDSIEDYIVKELCTFAHQPKVAERIENKISLYSYEKKKNTYRLYITKYQNIRKNGLFFSIFLPEIRKMGKVISQVYTETELLQKEYDKLLDFLYGISTKESGEDVKLTHETHLTKIGIILVARTETWNKFGVEPYVNRASKLINNGYQTIYIVSAGVNNKFSSMVVREINKKLPVKTHPKRDVKISSKRVVRIYKIDVI